MVWKADTRGRVQAQPLYKNNLQESIKDVIFRPSAQQDPSMYVTTDVIHTCHVVILSPSQLREDKI
mgnify:CR=1 FL=1